MICSYEEFLENFEGKDIFVGRKKLKVKTSVLRGVSFNGFTKVNLYIVVEGKAYKVKSFMIDPYGRYDNRDVDDKESLNKEIRYVAKHINNVLEENTNLLNGEDKEGYIYASLESQVETEG